MVFDDVWVGTRKVARPAHRSDRLTIASTVATSTTGWLCGSTAVIGGERTACMSGGQGEQAPSCTAVRPAFSIMCSAYRCEAYLADTIESVRAQRFSDWELIVVDNGMSDDIAAIVARFADDPRVKLIRQENRRLAGGIAAAAAAATAATSSRSTATTCSRRISASGWPPSSTPTRTSTCCPADSFLFGDDHDLDFARSFLRRTTGLAHRLTLADLIGRPRRGALLRRVPPGGVVRRRRVHRER